MLALPLGAREIVRLPDQRAMLAQVSGFTAEGGARRLIALQSVSADLDAVAEKRIRKAGATPAFKGYHGYPATICASVNEEVIHGIPSGRRMLNTGDVISIDYDGGENGLSFLKEAEGALVPIAGRDWGD